MGKEITNVSIDILKVHPRNTEFFDDISGSEYEEFKNSIKEEGIISEIIVSPDMVKKNTLLPQRYLLIIGILFTMNMNKELIKNIVLIRK